MIVFAEVLPYTFVRRPVEVGIEDDDVVTIVSELRRRACRHPWRHIDLTYTATAIQIYFNSFTDSNGHAQSFARSKKQYEALPYPSRDPLLEAKLLICTENCPKGGAKRSGSIQNANEQMRRLAATP